MEDTLSKEISRCKIVNIKTREDIDFVRKLITGIIAVAYNHEYAAFTMDGVTIFVCSIKSHKDCIIDIFTDSDIMKLISKPLPSLKILLGDNVYANCKNISSYLREANCSSLISKIKRSIIEQGNEPLVDRVVGVALLIIKYKILSTRPQGRDCYLLYLTVYNDILSNYGPMRFTDLTRIARGYPYLCRTKLHPALALEGLISVGALLNDKELVFIPDQILQ